MNSATRPMGRGGALALLAAVILAALAAGCGDHGPTNLYSDSLFGQKQSGPSLAVWNVQEYSLSTTAGVGPDQYVVWLKNTGAGGAIGPITGTVTLQTCSGVTLANTTATFGSAGQAIYPGDIVLGNATNMSGPYQYTWETGSLPAACSNTAAAFSVTFTDTKGGSWTGTFTGTNE